MIDSEYFLNSLISHEFQFFSGVPCSYLTSFINNIMQSKVAHYIPASSEGEALAMASGAWLAGKKSVVMCQNSGLGNMVNPLTSLNAPFRIPVLLLITWRGHPDEKDEPQHEVMGKITTDLLDLMQIKWSFFPEKPENVDQALKTALASMEESQAPYALLLRKGSFNEIEENSDSQNISYPRACPSREEALQTLLNNIPENSPIIATTGKTGRELYTLQDTHNHLYCVGSMGYANALAHGIALNTPKKVYIIDGDGAAIMHLGNLVTIGATSASNLVHIVLDNHAYDSTGAQPTASKHIDFSLIARGAGYKTIYSCSTLEELAHALQYNDSPGPVFMHIKIRIGSMKKLGRPSKSPEVIARRLREFITEVKPCHI